MLFLRVKMSQKMIILWITLVKSKEAQKCIIAWNWEIPDDLWSHVPLPLCLQSDIRHALKFPFLFKTNRNKRYFPEKRAIAFWHFLQFFSNNKTFSFAILTRRITSSSKIRIESVNNPKNLCRMTYELNNLKLYISHY